MRCSKHNKNNLDCWYDCYQCSEEYYSSLEIVVNILENHSKEIKRPITKVLDDLINIVGNHKTVNKVLRLKISEPVQPCPKDCQCGCQSLPW